MFITYPVDEVPSHSKLANGAPACLGRMHELGVQADYPRRTVGYMGSTRRTADMQQDLPEWDIGAQAVAHTHADQAQYVSGS